MEFIYTVYNGDIFTIFSSSLKQILDLMTKEEIVLGKEVILTRAVTWTNSSGSMNSQGCTFKPQRRVFYIIPLSLQQLYLFTNLSIYLI